MADLPEPRHKTVDIARLLHKAILGLEQDEREAVLEYFVECGIGAAPPVTALLRRELEPAPAGHGMIAFTGRSAGPSRQLVPVRLSVEQHQRLKQWCSENDFPMSVVVRGLVDRFLDQYQPPDPDPKS